MAISTAPAQALVGLDIDDPVQLEVVRNSLVSICEEMGVAMMRTSYSTMFNERATSLASSSTRAAR